MKTCAETPADNCTQAISRAMPRILECLRQRIDQAFGKPTITPKTPFEVKDLHGSMRLRALS
jgi:hypothetical protein